MNLFEKIFSLLSSEPKKVMENNFQIIKRFQKEKGLPETGYMDAPTMRRVLSEREAAKIELESTSNKRKIVCNNKFVDIEWSKVKTYLQEDNFKLPTKTFRKEYKERRQPKMVMVHWDVCLSSKTCYKVLLNRNLSVHFAIDNDGTIHQMMDTNHAARHSGSKEVDLSSIGIEVSDAYYTKYQETYRKMGLKKRPVLKNVIVHNEKLEPFLGFYPEQMKALKALIETLSKEYDIEIKMPTGKDGKVLSTVSQNVAQGTFNGIVYHYHATRRKIDCAGIDIMSMFKKEDE